MIVAAVVAIHVRMLYSTMRFYSFSSTNSEGRQTVMFSATWPEEIRSLADKFLKKDVLRVCVGGEELSANHRVKQIVECVTAMEKDRKLVKLLEDYHKDRKNRHSKAPFLRILYIVYVCMYCSYGSICMV